MAWRKYSARSSRAVAPSSEASDAETLIPQEDDASVPRLANLGAVCLVAYVIASAVVPNVVVFGTNSHTAMLLAAFVSSITAATFALETLSSARFSIRTFAKKVRNPSILISSLPFGIIFYAARGNHTLTTLAMLAFLARFHRVFGDYWANFLVIVKDTFPTPPLQLIRLGWLAILVAVMQSLASCSYYALGEAALNGTSWIDGDGIRDDDSQRQIEDPSSPAMLRISRSIYFVWQTLLTVGYGGIAPEALQERALALIVCLAGVFLMAYMIANMTSYLVNLDSTPAAHRFTLDSVEALFAQKSFPNASMRIARRDLARQWVRSKGLSREKVLDDLPPILTRNIISHKARALLKTPIFRLPRSADPCRRVIYYLVDKMEPSIFEVGRTLREPWNVISYRPGVMWFMVDGTAAKRSTSRHPPAQMPPSAPSKSRSLRARATSQFRQNTATEESASGTAMATMSRRRSSFRGGPNPFVERSFTASSAMLWGEPGMDPHATDVPNDLAQEIGENYPDLLMPGATIGALRLFDILQSPAPRYVAVTRCELVFITYVDFRRMALLFPEWGMESTSLRVMCAMEARRIAKLASHDNASEIPAETATANSFSSAATEGGPVELDDRVIDQIDAECNYTSLLGFDDDDDDDAGEERKGKVKNDNSKDGDRNGDGTGDGNCNGDGNDNGDGNGDGDDMANKHDSAENAREKDHSEVVTFESVTQKNQSFSDEDSRRKKLSVAMASADMAAKLRLSLNKRKETTTVKKRSKIAAIMQQDLNEKRGDTNGFVTRWLIRFRFAHGSRADFLWDCALAVILASYGIFVPIHLATMIIDGTSGFSNLTRLTALGAFCGDTIFLAYWTLRPQLVIAEDEQQTSRNPRGSESYSQNQKRRRHSASSSAFTSGKRSSITSSQVFLSAIAWSTQQEALTDYHAKMARRRARFIEMMGIFSEVVLTFLSLVSLGLMISGDAQHKRLAVFMRVPFLIRLSRIGSITDSLGSHFAAWRQRQRQTRAVRADEAAATGTLAGRSAGTSRIAEETDNQNGKGPFLSARLGVYFLLWAHLIACYGMTILNDAEDDSTSERYAKGMYWSLATMTTTGFGDYEPTSARDSLITSALAIIGVSIYSCLVSFIGTLLKDVEFSDNNISHQRTCLMAFLLDRKISPQLQEKIMLYLHHVEAKDLLVLKRVLGVSESKQTEKFGHRGQRQALDSEEALASADLLRSASSLRAVYKGFWDRIREQIAGRDVTTCPRSHESDFLRADVRLQLVFDLAGTTVRSSKLFEHVSEAFVREACALLDFRIISAGDVIIDDVNAGWELYFLATGSIEVRDRSDIKLSNIGEGQSFGEQTFAEISQSVRELDVADARNGDIFSSSAGSPSGALKASVTKADKEKTRFIATTVAEVWVLSGRAVRHLSLLFPQDGESIEAAEAKLLSAGKSESVASNLRRGGKLAKMAGNDMVLQDKRKAPRVIRLDSHFQATWKRCMLFSLLWIYISFPVRFAFVNDYEPGPTALIIDSCVDILLILDVVLRVRFFELETVQGERLSIPAEFRPAYLRSLFGVTDILSALPIGLVALMAGAPHNSLFRLNKLFRGSRTLDHLASIGSHVKNQARKSLLTIAKLIFVFMLVAHWAGCLFYRIAAKYEVECSSSTERISWVCEQNVEAENDMLDDYINALYFAVATITAVGFGDVVPISQEEILYTIGILIIGGLLYSVIIAFLEDIVAQSDLTSILYQKKSDLISAYASMREFSPQLRSNIRSYVFRSWIRQKGVNDDHVLSYLSRPLRQQVALELIGEQTLRRTPVLGPSRVWRFVTHSIRFDRFRRHSILYHAGQTGDQLFFLLKGSVEVVSPDLERVFYQVESPGGVVGIDGFLRARDGGYPASARCKESCEVAILDRSAVANALIDNPHLVSLFEEELRKFVTKPSQLEHTMKNLDKRKLTKMFQNTEQSESTGRKRGFDLNHYVLMPGHFNYVLFHAILFHVTIEIGILVPLWAMMSATDAFAMQDTSGAYIGISLQMDLFLWCFIGVNAMLVSRVKNGRVLSESKDIRRASLRSFGFAIDVIATLPFDLIGLAVAESAGSSSPLHVYLLLRLLRLLWLRHIPRCWTIFDNAIDASARIQITSGYRHLIKIVATVLLVTHWLACGYARVLISTRSNWPCQTMSDDCQANIGRAYIDSIYFTFYTVTTIGFGNVPVIGIAERIFAIFVMVVGSFLCDAGITSTLVSIVDIEDSTAAAGNRYRDAALQLMDHMQLSSRMTGLVRAYYAYRVEEMAVKDSDCFRELPFSLHNAVKEFLGLRALRTNAVQCKNLRDLRDGLLVSLFRSLRNEVIIPMEKLYNSGSRVLRLVFIARGRVLAFAARDLSKEQLRKLGSSRNILRRRISLQSSFTQRNLKTDEASAELWNPGLLLPSVGWGEVSPVTLVTGSFCDALICDQMVYEELVALRPPVGGLYSSAKALLENKEDAKHLRAFLERRFMAETVNFVQLVDDFRRSPNNEVMRAKRAATIVSRFIVPDADEAISIRPEVANDIVRRVEKDPAPEVFDEAYEAATATLEKEILPQFQTSPEYEKLLSSIHCRSVFNFVTE